MRPRCIHRAAVLLVLTFLAVVAAQHVLRPELTPTDHQVSEYANGSAGPLMVFGFLAWAASVACTCASAVMVSARPRGVGPVIVALLLACAAVGLALTAMFPTRTVAGALPTGVSRDAVGLVHDLASGAVLTSLAVAAPLSLMAFRWPEAERHLATGLLLVAAAIAVGLASLDAYPGLRQRGLLLAACGWQVLLLQAFLRGSGSGEPRRGPPRRDSTR